MVIDRTKLAYFCDGSPVIEWGITMVDASTGILLDRGVFNPNELFLHEDGSKDQAILEMIFPRHFLKIALFLHLKIHKCPRRFAYFLVTGRLIIVGLSDQTTPGLHESLTPTIVFFFKG